MTYYVIFPDIDPNGVFAPEVRQAIADSPELQAAFAPSSGSDQYVSSTSVLALLASKLNISEKGIPLGLATLDANAKIPEANIPERLSIESQNANLVTQWKPTTFYPVGAAVVDPNGDVVTAKAGHTSDAEYNPAQWNRPSVDGGTP